MPSLLVTHSTSNDPESHEDVSVDGLSSLEGESPPMISPVFDEGKKKKPRLSVAVADTREVLVQQNSLMASSVNTLLSEVRNSVNQKRYLSFLIGSVQVRSRKRCLTASSLLAFDFVSHFTFL